MAERRMFSRTVVGSARFLKLSREARLLYYDLGMDADDDGFVEAFAVLRKTSASEEELNLLARQGLVEILDENLVTRICDWNRNNQIRKDRYRPSIYRPLYAPEEPAPEEAEEQPAEAAPQPCENQAADTQAPLDNQMTTNWQPGDNHLATNRQPTGNHLATQDRLGKVRVVQDSQDKNNSVQCNPGKDSARPRLSGARPWELPAFPLPPLDLVEKRFKESGLSSKDAGDFLAYFTRNGWKSPNGTPLGDWTDGLLYWMTDRKRIQTGLPPLL